MEPKKKGIMQSDGMRRFLKNRLSILGIVILLVIILLAVFADVGVCLLAVLNSLRVLRTK